MTSRRDSKYRMSAMSLIVRFGASSFELHASWPGMFDVLVLLAMSHPPPELRDRPYTILPSNNSSRLLLRVSHRSSRGLDQPRTVAITLGSFTHRAM